MCKKSIYKKNLLLCTIAGTFIFSHFAQTYANTQPPTMTMVRADKAEEEKTFKNVFVRSRYTTGVADDKAFIIIKDSTMRSDGTVLSASTGGHMHAKKIVGKADVRGLDITNGTIHVEDSIITVPGHHKSYGIRFDYISDSYVKEGEKVINKAILTNTKLLMTDGIGIVGPLSSKSIAEVSLKNSEIRADMLLKNKSVREDNKPKILTLTADHSIMEGKVKTLPQNVTAFTLNNGSKWHLKASQFEVEDELSSSHSYTLLDIKQRTQSVVSILNLNNSSIIFNAPHDSVKGYYQTLNVGKHPQAEESEAQENASPNEAIVYNATGDAKIYFNTEWSNGLEKEQQKTDRLLVRGNVSGTTTIYFNNLSNSEISNTEDFLPLNTRGLSLIQVFGKADETAFKLANGYVTMNELPYKYVLNAYGPTSSRGNSDDEQSFLEEGKDFWDFRLQNATLDLQAEIRALVPQVASYLVMPNAVFSTGLSDVSQQNALLDHMRSSTVGAADNKNKGIFFSGYGNKMTLSSHRTPLQYGYGADVHYGALQAGITLATLEDQNITTNLGLLGTYGKLAFTPKDIEGADKSTLDKWSLVAYGSFHHDIGFYGNALFSYGALNGNITTAFRGKTAELKNTAVLNISATVGQRLATGTKGLIFEPQAQLIYQHVAFGTLSDVDSFNVDMETPHQWLLRVGGRLTQTTLPLEKDCAVSFYGKLNVIKTFSGKGTIQIGDTFHLDPMGAAIEGGFGVNAKLSQNIALHADVNYQQKLQKAGISGINVSGGMRYHF
ncbi:autotransporter outer membrane beta-barrel domain-containing protein [Bartonella acomydis]|uniref:Autotransporter domain-containing protein n=1 Tax=Bartonella acomydis TaxID=686234 RepID=A0ABP9MXK9_9HYPH